MANVTLLTGGSSFERNVALAGSGLVAAALRSRGHQVVVVDTVRGPVRREDEERWLDPANFDEAGRQRPCLDAGAAGRRFGKARHPDPRGQRIVRQSVSQDASAVARSEGVSERDSGRQDPSDGDCDGRSRVKRIHPRDRDVHRSVRRAVAPQCTTLSVTSSNSRCGISSVLTV